MRMLSVASDKAGVLTGFTIETLISLSGALAAVRTRDQLNEVVNTHLKKRLRFNEMVVFLLDRDGITQRLYLRHFEKGRVLTTGHVQLLSLGDYSLSDGILDAVVEAGGPVVWTLAEVLKGSSVPWYARFWAEHQKKRFAGIPLVNNSEVMGTAFFCSSEESAFPETEISLLRAIGPQLSAAVANILANEEILQREKEKTTLLALSGEVAGIRSQADLYRVIKEKVKKILPVSHILICVINPGGKTYSPAILDPDSPWKNHKDYAEIVAGNCLLDDGIAGLALAAEQPVTYDLARLAEQPHVPRFLKMNYEYGCKEVVFCPLGNGGSQSGFLVLFMNEPGFPNTNYTGMVRGVAAQLSTAIANIVANGRIEAQLEEISKYKQRLENENLYLQEEIQTAHNFSEIIGTSEAMQRVFKGVSQVAATQTTVLIQGETGTGKELIARALHSSSVRQDKVMVKVNCAALPANLIESELFGHEKGSFTGAMERRIGKFELAHNSTLFLDEVGELPLDLQVKLLRVLQEREIERIGGNSTIRVDVRIIAATNRDLQREVQLGNFRSDLYFRLSVFPISLPPLRIRKEDIAPMANHFLAKYARKDGKGSLRFSERVIRRLMDYNWPGNVRELEHLVERSILLANGPVIDEVHLSFPGEADPSGADLLTDRRIKTIDEVEREHIIAVLRKFNGKVSGPGGAAEALQIPSTTLNSKMKRLKIKKAKFGI